MFLEVCKRIQSNDKNKMLKSINSKKVWKRKEHRNKISIKMKEYYSDPVKRQILSDNVKAGITSYTLKKKSENSKKMWKSEKRRKLANDLLYKGNYPEIWLDNNLFIEKCKEIKILSEINKFFNVKGGIIFKRLKSLGVDCSFLIKHVSGGEKLIERFLLERGFKFVREYWVKECRDILPLRFDFYLPDHNTIIEYQGQHHYFPINYKTFTISKDNDFLEKLEKQQYHDELKRKYCLKNDIKLIEIRFDENIYKILESKLIFVEKN